MKINRISLRIITLNIAYLWHFFSDQNSFGSNLRSLTFFWWELSWIMVLTEDLLSLRLACIILYLWDFLRLGKKVKYNQRLVVNFWLQDGVSCSISITIIIFTSGSYLTFPNWKSINGFYTILSVCIFGYVWINILSQQSRPTIFGSQILSSGDQRSWYSRTFSLSFAWIHKWGSASSDFHQTWKCIILKCWKVQNVLSGHHKAQRDDHKNPHFTEARCWSPSPNKNMNSNLSSLYIIIEACSVNFYLTQ